MKKWETYTVHVMKDILVGGTSSFTFRVNLGYNIRMFGLEKIDALEAKVRNLSEGLKAMSNRQNSRYMYLLSEINLIKQKMEEKGINFGVTKASSKKDDYLIDELCGGAFETVASVGKVSTSYIQNKFNLGYSWFAKLMNGSEKKEVNKTTDNCGSEKIPLKKSDISKTTKAD